MAKRNDIAPFERPQARKWTRVGDYVQPVEPHVDLRFPHPPRAPEISSASRFGRKRRGSARGFLLPVGAVALAAALSLWASGLVGNSSPKRPLPQATTSRGLTFGLCSEGGLTNCVASGDSFYLGGRTVRIAAIEAPQLYGAACPREAELGRRSAAKLRQLLNSGEIELRKIGPDLDRLGLLLRSVSVDGKDVGEAMVAARLARDIGDSTTGWC